MPQRLVLATRKTENIRENRVRTLCEKKMFEEATFSAVSLAANDTLEFVPVILPPLTRLERLHRRLRGYKLRIRYAWHILKYGIDW
jgi:hypothetical protein